MSKDYTFNAPTFYNFDPQYTNEDIEKVETYFEIDHESSTLFLHNAKTNGEHISEAYPGNSDNTQSDDIQSENHVSDISDDVEEEQPEARLRRSMSLGNLPLIDESTGKLRNLNINTSHSENGNIGYNDRLNKLAKPKCNAQNKYVSTAEQVNKFYGTPARFRTGHKKLECSNKPVKMQAITLPQSPSLATRRRQRNTQILSREEIEKLEVEELRKYKIKALPINQKILQGPVKPIAIAKKPVTAVRPFNLTECQSKKIEQPQEQYEFHARPLPKTIYERTSSGGKLDQNKKLNTRLFGSREKLKVEPVKAISAEKPFKPSRTEPVPFSFDARDQQIPKRREEMVNKVLEEERKAREFRAKPPPQYVRVLKKTQSLSSVKTNKSEDEASDARVNFKARSPAVLYHKPFEPKKPERPLLEVTEFCLNTERRAKEREEFDKKMQEKLNQFELEKAQREIERMRYEEEETARLRKETVHVSQPVRHYKELKITPSGKVTLPKTPDFKSMQRSLSRNKENCM